MLLLIVSKSASILVFNESIASFTPPDNTKFTLSLVGTKSALLILSTAIGAVVSALLNSSSVPL